MRRAHRPENIYQRNDGYRVPNNIGFDRRRGLSPRAAEYGAPVDGFTWASRELKGSRMFPLLNDERCKCFRGIIPNLIFKFLQLKFTFKGDYYISMSFMARLDEYQVYDPQLRMFPPNLRTRRAW